MLVADGISPLMSLLAWQLETFWSQQFTWIWCIWFWLCISFKHLHQPYVLHLVSLFSLGWCRCWVEVCSCQTLVLLLWGGPDAPRALQPGPQSKNHAGTGHSHQVPAAAACGRTQREESRDTARWGIKTSVVYSLLMIKPWYSVERRESRHSHWAPPSGLTAAPQAPQAPPQTEYNVINTVLFKQVNLSFIFQLGESKNSGSFGASTSPTRYRVCIGVCLCVCVRFTFQPTLFSIFVWQMQFLIIPQNKVLHAKLVSLQVIVTILSFLKESVKSGSFYLNNNLNMGTF